MKTEAEKLHYKQRQALTFIHNSTRSAWSSGHIHTWGDVYAKCGKSSFSVHGDSEALKDFSELKQYLQQQTNELEEKIKPQQMLPVARGQSNKETLQHPSEVRGQSIQIVPLPANNGGEVVEQRESIHTDRDGQSPDNKGIDAAPSSQHKRDDKQSVLSLTEKNDYGYTRSPNVAPFYSPYWFQKKAVTELLDKIVVKDYKGILLLSGTGTGKTFITADTSRHLKDLDFFTGKTFSHIEQCWITRTTVVEQTERVCGKYFNLQPEADIDVLNIEQLRSKRGKFWLKEKLIIVGGEEEIEWSWKPALIPPIIWFDESQAAKNKGSTQHKIMCAYAKTSGVIVHISATPFVTVEEAKCFAISTRRPIEHLGFPPGTLLTEDNWTSYSKIIAAPASPSDVNEAAIERLMKDLDDYVVRVKGVRPQFDPHNCVEKIYFETKEEAETYNKAWEAFLKEKAKWEEGIGEHPFVILLKFSMAAEYIRRRQLAKRMYEAVQRGKAAVCACKFKQTIIGVVQILISEYGVDRNDISLVWGGGQTPMSKKQKEKRKIILLKDKLAKAGIDVNEMLQDLDLDTIEDREIMNLPANLRLESQSMDERQREIDKFQVGNSKYCIFTFRAGGVGLSLHHSDELTTFKCRRKESGYAVEEDIPKVPVREREAFIAPTYSAIELVQGLGRCPRLTSLSPTKQTLLFYGGTVEDDIADIVSQKLRCLSKVVRMKEAWADVIIGQRSVDEAKQTTNNISNDSVEDELDSGGEE